MSAVDNAAILHISTARPQSGAGGAALSTHLSLRKRGIDSKMLFLAGVSDEARGLYSFADTPYRKGRRLVVTTLDRLPLVQYRKRKQLFSPGLFGQNLRDHPLVRTADLIHLNWVNFGFVDVENLKQLEKPIVWTMHDMWPFTGGCHYSMGCERYTSRCGSCPVLGSNAENDLSSRCQDRKLRANDGTAVSWVGVSSWIAEQARSSTLLRDRTVEVIHSGIDTDVFRPHDRASARRELDLPAGSELILLGAHDLRSSFKGLQYSLDALKAVDSRYTVVTFGHASIDPSTIGQRLIHLGFIEDPQRMAKLYSAADLFLATSVAEAFGKTVAEAQCCGTPVVAFDGTGPRDIVEHRVTGYLAAKQDAADVAAGIEYCVSRDLDRDAISARAAERFSIERSTGQYVELYQRLLAPTC
jgi:glycosyltransferase involved in cell wall biosynthesis